MKVLSIVHLKGGVGKTTTAVNLAVLAAGEGLATLLADLDAQAAATYLLRLDASEGAKAARLAHAKKSLRDTIFASDYAGLDVLPASFSLRKLPTRLADEKKGRDSLRDTFSTVGKHHDLVVVDAPAGLSLESEAIVRASDLILAPVVPTMLAVESYLRLAAFVAKVNPKVPLRGFFSMVDRRRRVHREIVERLPAERQDILPVEIPNAAVVERMATERVPLAALGRAGARVAGPTRHLWDLVREMLYLHAPGK